MNADYWKGVAVGFIGATLLFLTVGILDAQYHILG